MSTAMHRVAPGTTIRATVQTRTVADLPCRTADPELFFAEAEQSIEAAKQLCADCPVRQGCLAAALERAEPWGVWGGELFERGAIVPRKRPRGRPRNADRDRDAAWYAAHPLTSVA